VTHMYPSHHKAVPSL